MNTHLIKTLTTAMVAGSLAAGQASASGSCSVLFDKGVLNLDFNPTTLSVQRYNGKDALFIPSFFNVEKTPGINYLDRDKAGFIDDVRNVNFNTFQSSDVEIFTDVALGQSSTQFGDVVWPADIEIVDASEGIFPFTGAVLAQGFLSATSPGRLSVINMDDPLKGEYIIDQSTQTGPFSFPLDPNNSPRWYSNVKFYDMDNDGHEDIIAARSGFRVVGGFHPPFGELVWFKNPGATLDPNTQWQETIIYGGPAAGFAGPDTDVEMDDFDGDGIPEIVALNFFAEKISLFGAPAGGTWADVNALAFQLPQVAVISDDQGQPFGLSIVDVNNDGVNDILATNHAPDNCTEATTSEVPGRVYALEKPADGNIYQAWTTHILKDNIRPQPSTLPVSPPGRLAPGRATAFNVIKFLDGIVKPRILVGGDEAGKTWVLRAKKPFDPSNWEYTSEVIFDINDFYGELTTQTEINDPQGVTISTQGGPTVGYHQSGPFGIAELYIPVFEGRDIHVKSYKWGWGRPLSQCGDEDIYECPTTP